RLMASTCSTSVMAETVDIAGGHGVRLATDPRPSIARRMPHPRAAGRSPCGVRGPGSRPRWAQLRLKSCPPGFREATTSAKLCQPRRQSGNVGLWPASPAVADRDGAAGVRVRREDRRSEVGDFRPENRKLPSDDHEVGPHEGYTGQLP